MIGRIACNFKSFRIGKRVLEFIPFISGRIYLSIIYGVYISFISGRIALIFYLFPTTRIAKD